MCRHRSPEGESVWKERLRIAVELVENEVAEGRVGAAATAISSRGKPVLSAAFGQTGWPDQKAPLASDAIFLIASLTKPIVCAGIMLLVQEGRLCLDQPVASVVPEFGTRGKASVLIRHLMTHTSGLPDQLADNVALRSQHASLTEFIASVCDLQLLFPPGTRVSYQSMGILMLQEIAERLTGRPLTKLLHERLFLPLGMNDTTLGLPASGMERAVRAVASADANYGDDETDWGWNSTYWRGLGAPWGGLHSTARDLATFLSHMLGEVAGPLGAPTRCAMLRDQIADMPSARQEKGQPSRWGLGWLLGSPSFGDLVSRRTFGHTGATGTLFWADPDSGTACVLLTNQPQRGRFLFPRYSNTVAAAFGSDTATCSGAC